MMKPQRVRDPLHNLIEFANNRFEGALWNAIQTRPFQRLRRVKQLGFSDLVYPGATHSRFAHSIGVFHTARMLMKIIENHLGEANFNDTRADQALAAALVHDLGHGPFSHAFEDVGKRLNLKMAIHEDVSDALIRDSEVTGILNSRGSGFANDVANIIKSKGPTDIYGAVVSSQFDADRLDYMQRDRLMSGTQHGMIDFKWLLANLRVGEAATGVDEASTGTIETFVLGPKAVYAAESYVLGLFQLYPTVYFHKTTRGAEKLFTELLCRVITLIQAGHIAKTGLTENHPIARFALDANNVQNALALDDAVIWGAVSQMGDAKDSVTADLAKRLRDRNLYKSLNVREMILSCVESRPDEDKVRLVEKATIAVRNKIASWNTGNASDTPRILSDEVERSPYKKFDESKGPLNQIRILTHGDELVDLGERSKIVKAIEPFRVFRVYYAEQDSEAKTFVEKTIREEAQNVTSN